MKTLKIPQATKAGYIEVCEEGCFDMSYPTSKTRRGRVQGGGGILSPTLTAGETGIVKLDKVMAQTERPQGKGWCWDEEEQVWFRFRKLTPRTCFRLMDVKESDIDKLMATHINKKGKEQQIVSNSQLYKCAGNSIVVSPMKLTFKNLFFPETKESNKMEEAQWI